MKQLTVKDLKNACFNPVTGEVRRIERKSKPGAYLSDDWKGSVLDLLKLKEPSPRDLVSIVLSSQDWLDDDENQKIGKKFRDLLMNDKGVKSDTSLLTLAARIAREKDYGVVRKAMITALQ